MRKVQIITDSCSDLTPKLMQRYGIDYARMNTVYMGKTAPADLAWTDEDVRRFYQTMRNGGRITTTQVPVEEFNRVFRRHLDAGSDIVYVGCSVKQSGSVNTATVLAKKLMQEYPEAKIHCINSLRASMGEGMLAIKAAEYAAAGADADQVAAYITDRRNEVWEFVAVHTLDYLKRAGRVKASSAFFGNLLGVKPIIIADADGDQVAYKKVKGRSASLAEIVNLLKEHVSPDENQTIYIAHADSHPSDVLAVKKMIEREIPCKDIHVSCIGPIIGASIGPEAIAVLGFGEKVTYKGGEK